MIKRRNQADGAEVQRGKRADLTYLLHERERGVIKQLCKDYKQRFKLDPHKDPNFLIHLGDNPARRSWSAVSGRIPTLRKGGGLTWSVPLRRFLTGREKLATLGFPVTSTVAAAMNVPPVPVLDLKRCSLVAGNAMHLSCVGIVQLVALCSYSSTKAKA